MSGSHDVHDHDTEEYVDVAELLKASADDLVEDLASVVRLAEAKGHYNIPGLGFRSRLDDLLREAFEAGRKAASQ